jgi:hypothetical protein
MVETCILRCNQKIPNVISGNLNIPGKIRLIGAIQVEALLRGKIYLLKED